MATMQEMLDVVSGTRYTHNTYLYMNGDQFVIRFDNNYGASIIRNDMSYGSEKGLWELAVLHFAEGFEDYALCYMTSITDDVIGWLTPKNVEEILYKIKALAPLNYKFCKHHPRFMEN